MRGLWRRVLEIVNRSRLDREAREELDLHVAMLVARYTASGLSDTEARRRARLDLGPPGPALEQVVEGRTGFALEQALREIRYAARILRRSPGLTLLSVVTMGVGISASAVLFSLLYTVVLQPLPYPDPDRLVAISDTNAEAGIERAGAASGNINDWRRRTSAFEGLAGFYAMGRTLHAGGEADVLITAQVSEDFFPLLEVSPVVGRTFTADETRRATFSNAATPTGPDGVVILSHKLWRQRFGADPGVVGQTVMLERRPYRIVGVMPATFAIPDRGVQLWIPWSLDGDRPRDQHYLRAVARLAPGVSMAQAESELNAVAAALAAEHPTTNRGWGVRLSPLHAELVGDTARLLWVLFAAVGLVLLVSCATVALLAVIREIDRADETAVRLALGASAARLVRESVAESTLLASLGGAVGAALAAVALRVLPTLPMDLPRLDEVALDLHSMAFIAGVSALAAIVSGLPQAWRRTRLPPASGLAGASPRTTRARRRLTLRDGLVVCQIALAVVLLASAGLLVRSVQQLRAIDPGFDPQGVLVAPVFLDGEAYLSGARTRAYYQAVFERLAAIPGVTAVGGATTVPASPLGPDFERPVWREDTGDDVSRRTPASVRMVTPGYIPALGLRMIEGRPIDDRDRPAGPPVVMVSESLARRLWPGESAVGRRLTVDYSTAGTYPYEIIGVVGDIRFRGPRSAPAAEIYIPHAQRSYLVMHVVLRASGDPRLLAPTVRAALKEVDPLKPAHGIYALADLIGATYARDRNAMLMLILFAGASVLLAVLGIYGVLSQRVRERAQEIGIRMAMGASPWGLVRWVAGAGMRLTVAGTVVGLAAAVLVARLLGGLLFGVAPSDPANMAVVAGLIALVGLAATLVPAIRATRVDPITALRRG